MTDKFQLTSADKKSEVLVVAGELGSYRFDGIETMHQKGSPGWGNTEIEMFPIVGPTNEIEYTIQTPRGPAKLDQHGIARAMSYKLFEETASTLKFKKSYLAGSLIANPKFPKKSSLEKMQWPYDFELIKTFELVDEALTVRYEIKAEKGMPFMLGFHPAFKIYNEAITFRTGSEKFQLKDIMEMGSSAFLQKDKTTIHLENNGTLDLKLSTKGFPHFMLWTEVKNMVCVEPITFYPASLSQQRMHEGFDLFNGEEFELRITPTKA